VQKDKRVQKSVFTDWDEKGGPDASSVSRRHRRTKGVPVQSATGENNEGKINKEIARVERGEHTEDGKQLDKISKGYRTSLYTV
jgi:hypothetical protein